MRRALCSLLLTVTLLAACTAPELPRSTPPIDTGLDVNAWASIPPGEFLYGLHESVIDLPYEYQIMLSDVTNAQYAAYLNQALAQGELHSDAQQISGYYPGDPFLGMKHEEPIQEGNWPYYPVNARGSRLEYDGQVFSVQPGYENHPVVMVTWFGARGYCLAGGGRLPDEYEWEKAARGTQDNRAYPWGNNLERAQANYYSSRDIFEKVLGKGGDTTPVGFYNGRSYDGYTTLDGASPYGLYDMAGNVWQWTANVYPGTHYRYLRGGSKADYGYNLRLWTRNNVRPDYMSPNIGFRCVKGGDPQAAR